MSGLDPRTIAKALKGDLAGGQILAPGPGHSARDRSLSVKPDSGAPDGFTVFSMRATTPMQCRDHVRASLGMPQWTPGQGRRPKLEYIYRDAEGRPYLRVTRTPEKKFWQHKWDGSGWIKGAPRPKIPYRLPELLSSRPHRACLRL